MAKRDAKGQLRKYKISEGGEGLTARKHKKERAEHRKARREANLVGSDGYKKGKKGTKSKVHMTRQKDGSLKKGPAKANLKDGARKKKPRSKKA